MTTTTTFPVLYKTTKTGKIMAWKIQVKDDTYWTESWYLPEGKAKTTLPTTCTGKNVGRANETTPHEQALKEAHALWKKKIDHQYEEAREEPRNEEPRNEEVKNRSDLVVVMAGFDMVEICMDAVRPMLANTYDKVGLKYLSEPFAVSPKLDGVRAVYENGRLTTRNGIPIHHMRHIVEELRSLLETMGCPEMVVDGELYSSTLTFNQITSATRQKSRPSPIAHLVEYWIFDVVTDDTYYTKRHDVIKRMQEAYEGAYDGATVLRFVTSADCIHEQMPMYCDKYMAQGYEGVMARQWNSKYQKGTRSNYLLKYKRSCDDEFVIVDTTSGLGNEEGAILFLCETKDGKVFTVRPRGSVAERRKMMKKPAKYYKGKQLTVKYQELDGESGIPRFPVGLSIRDYE
jgi:DNA ligase 1